MQVTADDGFMLFYFFIVMALFTAVLRVMFWKINQGDCECCQQVSDVTEQDINNNYLPEEYYQVLGVQPGARWNEIEKAYRQLAKIHNPSAGGDINEYRKIKEAYRILETYYHYPIS